MESIRTQFEQFLTENGAEGVPEVVVLARRTQEVEPALERAAAVAASHPA